MSWAVPPQYISHDGIAFALVHETAGSRIKHLAEPMQLITGGVAKAMCDSRALEWVEALGYDIENSLICQPCVTALETWRK